jgi:hypothetical protein
MRKIRLQVAGSGRHCRESNRTAFSSRENTSHINPIPTTIEIVVASPAPATPIGRPVSQPAISTGESSALISTETIWTSMVGLTTPVPRKAAPMLTSGNWSARPGRNQWRNVVPAATVAGSAPRRFMYQSTRPTPTSRGI